MSRSYDDIKDITDFHKEIWKLAVKVDDFWTNMKSGKEFAEIIVRDLKMILYMLCFNLMIDPNEIPNVSVSGFKFKKFEKIKALNFREDLLMSLGLFMNLVLPKLLQPMENLTFHSLSKTRVELFWIVSFGKMWHPSSWSPLGHVILIIHRARLQKPTDRYPLQISNSWNVNKLIFNEDINDLKKSLPADNTYGTQAK
ncbi:hypothetical protein QL285_010043 [Trifolium repens]|nr:hypothetical protein QL285_010043 [Trifolium repens]